jgi:hypothetical protein
VRTDRIYSTDSLNSELKVTEIPMTIKYSNLFKILSSFLGLLLALSTFVAAANASDHYFGIQGGWNSSTLSEQESFSLDNTNNYLIGIVGVFSLTPWLSFQPEILYSVKGASATATNSTRSYDVIHGTNTLTYIEIPMLLRVMYPNNSNVTPHIFGGPAVAANWSAEAYGTWDSRVVNGDIEDLITNGDLAFIFGGGVDFGLSITRLSIDVRYTYGLIPVDICRFTELLNRVWTISATLMFKIGEADNN